MFESLQQMQEICEEKGISFWELVMQEEINEKQSTPEEVFDMMQEMYHAMVLADEGYQQEKSSSGMVGGAGALMAGWNRNGKTLAGPFLGQVMERALKMAESNACMKRIVAAPTAGSCGVLPAVLITYQKEENCPEEEVVKALFVSAGIGGIIASRASIAGAQGGLSGGDRFSQCHGGRSSDISKRRKSATDLRGCSTGIKRTFGTGV